MWERDLRIKKGKDKRGWEAYTTLCSIYHEVEGIRVFLISQFILYIVGGINR